MAGDTSGNKTMVRELKEQLVKAARMYAMCQKAGVAEPLDVTALAVAFEDLPLRQAVVLVRTPGSAGSHPRLQARPNQALLS